MAATQEGPTFLTALLWLAVAAFCAAHLLASRRFKSMNHRTELGQTIADRFYNPVVLGVILMASLVATFGFVVVIVQLLAE